MADPKQGTVDISELMKKENPTVAETDLISEHIRDEQIKANQKEDETPEAKTEREAAEKIEQEARASEGLAARAKEVGLEEGASEEAIIAKEKEVGKVHENDEEKANREKAETEAKEAMDQEVKAFAAENKVSEDDARKELEHIQNVGKKYGNDTKKLSKAFLAQQRENVKLQERLKDISKPKPLSAEQIPLPKMVELIEGGHITVNGKAVPKEQVLEGYRQQFPDITEGLEDDKVLQLAAKDLRDKFIENAKVDQSKISEAASKKRAALLEALSPEDKAFIADIQPILDKTPDEMVLAEDYTINEYILYSRGKNAEAREKAAYERGLKKGKEEAKIVGQKPPVGGGLPPVKKDNQETNIAAMSEADKNRAKAMYDGSPMTEKEMFLAYIEYKDSDKKKK
jgi:hypothetical protein